MARENVSVQKAHRGTSNALFSHSQTYSFETGSLSEPGAMLGVTKRKQSSCLHPAECWGYRSVHTATASFLCGR